MRKRYKKPKFPEGEFVLTETVDGDEYALWQGTADEFVPLDDGGTGAVYAKRNEDRPFVLRVVKQRGDVITHRDGAGELFTYRIREPL